MYYMGESKSKLEVFYHFFIELFLSYFFGPRPKHMLTKVIEHLSRPEVVCFFLGLLASFLPVLLPVKLTCGRQW